MHDICKTSAARGKAAHCGTTSGQPSSKSSKKAATSSLPSSAVAALSLTSVADQSSAASALSLTSVVDQSSAASVVSSNSTSNVSSLVPNSPVPSTTASDLSMLPPPALPNTMLSPPVPLNISCPSSLTLGGSQGLSVPSLTAINSSSNPRSTGKKSLKSTTSSKRRRDALDDGEEARSTTVRSSFISSDIPTPPGKSTNATSMVTLAGAVASLGTSINHQTMSSDTQIANRVQGFINGRKYLTDYQKSLLGEFYALQPTLASALMSMTAPIAKITLRLVAVRFGSGSAYFS